MQELSRKRGKKALICEAGYIIIILYLGSGCTFVHASVVHILLAVADASSLGAVANCFSNNRAIHEADNVTVHALGPPSEFVVPWIARVQRVLAQVERGVLRVLVWKQTPEAKEFLVLP